MAKKNGNQKTEISDDAMLKALEQLSEQLKQGADQDGYQEASDDLDGYWLLKLSPIHFRPTAAKIFDNKQDPKKPSVLIIGTLLSPCALRRGSKDDDDDGGAFIGKPGMTVGVWGKPGMRMIRSLCGSKVLITVKGEKDTGKVNPMMTFSIKYDRMGTQIPIIEDTRKVSREARHILETATDIQRRSDSTEIEPWDADYAQQ